MLEPTEVARWERLTAAMLRHAAQDDPEAFAQVVAVLDQARAQLPTVVDQLRHADPGATPARSGYSWADIGRALGVTRSAAQQRFGRKG